jgi:hypothetical protein
MIKDLYGKYRIDYKSRYPISESVKRLKAVVRSGWNPFPLREGVCGKVSEDRVRLYRVIPFVNNSFIPIFTGSFKRADGSVVLSGSFSMHPFVKIFMTVWFTGVISGSVLMAIQVFRGVGTGKAFAVTPALLIPMVMVLFGILLVKVGKWFSRNDIAYISRVVDDALNEKS